MIKAVIIDDEETCILSLAHLIREYCPHLSLVATCSSAEEGITTILKHLPELVFLDIEMPVKNGFEVLEEIRQIPVRVIFTTAYHHHAIKAIRYSALDYLLKPIDPKELIQAVNRYIEYRFVPDIRQLQFLIDKFAQKEYTSRKIAIPNMEGFNLISIDDILYCQADDNYTRLKLKKNAWITASRTLKDIQYLLEDFDFFLRIHHSYLVNLNEVKQYIKGEGGFVVMSDQSHLQVSRNKRETLLKYLSKGNK